MVIVLIFIVVSPSDSVMNSLTRRFFKFVQYFNLELMQFYACGASRKVNDESVLDCSEFFKNPGSLKDEYEAVWKRGGKRSQVERLNEELKEAVF